MYTAVLMLAMVSTSDTADFSGGRRGGGGGCCGSYGGGYYGGYGGGCYGGYGGGCGGYYGGGSRYSGGYGGMYYGGMNYGGMNYGGYYPSTGYSYAPSINNNYADPNAMAQNQNLNQNLNNTQQSFYNDPSSATIRVHVPSPDTKIWFDDKQTQQSGPERIFFTPSLQNAGKYTVKARWTHDGQTVNRTRTVDVQPGQTVNIDFRQDANEKLSSPKADK